MPISKNIFCHIIAYYNRSPKQGVIFVMRLASTPQYKAKIHKILFSSVDCVIQLGNCIFCYINFDKNCISRNFPDSSRAGAVQFINLKSYDEDCLLRQCFTISITTIKTVTQTQTKPICLSSVDSFLSFTSSVLFSSCLVEVVFLSVLTFVVSAATVCLSSFLLKS